MKINQKEIVLIPFPFTNLEEAKVRPGIIISNDHFNSTSKDCYIAPLTTVLNERKLSININNNDLERGKIIRKSKIRVDKITPIEKSLIKMKIGKINNQTLEKIKTNFVKIF